MSSPILIWKKQISSSSFFSIVCEISIVVQVSSGSGFVKPYFWKFLFPLTELEISNEDPPPLMKIAGIRSPYSSISPRGKVVKVIDGKSGNKQNFSVIFDASGFLLRAVFEKILTKNSVNYLIAAKLPYFFAKFMKLRWNFWEIKILELFVKIEFFVKNRIFRQKSNFSWKIEFFVKDRIFRQNRIYLQK